MKNKLKTLAELQKSTAKAAARRTPPQGFRRANVERLTNALLELDAPAMEEVIRTMARMFSDAAEGLTNMKAHVIAGHLNEAARTLAERTGN
jgi:hypothetical protein